MNAAAIAAACDSRESQSIMDKDFVRPAQATSYLALVPKVAEILPEVPVNAHGPAGGVTPTQSKALNELLTGTDPALPKSHIWVKGLVAVYIAASHGPEEEVTEDTQED